MNTLCTTASSDQRKATKTPLLRVENLSVSFSLQGEILQAVRGISFSVEPGEAVGIVGESGSGKSSAVQAITGLSPASHIEGAAWLGDIDLLQHKRHGLGTEIGMIFQDPMTSLNPTMKIGEQIIEAMLYHRLATRPEALRKAAELLTLVGIENPKIRLSQYPHHLSGGMRQRVLIAIALACNPKLLIADEPTTALDGMIQAQILELLKTLQQRLEMSLILISHDLRVIAKVCDKVLVFYAGQIVEQGPVAQVLHHPRHPYTQMLLAALPRCGRVLGIPSFEPLHVIEGAPPSLTTPPQGCAFKERCPYASAICQNPPPFFGSAACWKEKEP